MGSNPVQVTRQEECPVDDRAFSVTGLSLYNAETTKLTRNKTPIT